MKTSWKTKNCYAEDVVLKNNNFLLGVFGCLTADITSNKKPNQVVLELFIRGKKLNISTIFIIQTYFPVPKKTRLNCTHFFIMKIPNKQEFQQIAINHSSDINSKQFLIFTKNVLQNHILLRWLILLLH